MDPNATLATIRRLAEQANDYIYGLAPEGAAELLEAAIALDDWLSEGGFLPTAWERKS